MKWNGKLPTRAQWQSWLGKYKLVLLLVVAGVVLLAWPTGSSAKAQTDQKSASTVAGEEPFSVEELEERLAQAISRIQGAGTCTVLLSLDQGVERVLATDRVEERSGDESTQEETTVVYSGEDGEEVALVTQYYPSFRGALVVCAGGDDPQVRLSVTQAVSALTGLGSDRITVCAGE